MLGVDTESDWEVGSSLVHRGEWQGKPYEDKGEIVRIDPPKLLVHTHWSDASGTPDRPESYQEVTWALEERDEGTQLTVSERNLPSAGGQAGVGPELDDGPRQPEAVTRTLAGADLAPVQRRGGVVVVPDPLTELHVADGLGRDRHDHHRGEQRKRRQRRIMAATGISASSRTPTRRRGTWIGATSGT